jgi:hypothetical protein
MGGPGSGRKAGGGVKNKNKPTSAKNNSGLNKTKKRMVSDLPGSHYEKQKNGKYKWISGKG